MKHLSYDLWKSFSLPSNLYYILNDKYQEINTIPQQQKVKIFQAPIENQELPQQNNNQKAKNQICQSQIINRDTKLTLENISFEDVYSQSVISPDDIQTYLEILLVEIDDNAILAEVILLIKQSFTSIITNPKEEKYKKINIEKILSKYPYQSINNFFGLCSFKLLPDNKFTCFNGQIKDLAFVLNEIKLFLNSKSKQIIIIMI